MVYENVKKYGIYYLLKSYYKWKLNQNQDFWILIAGTEGSGKSSLAVHYGYILDDDYLKNINSRIVMSEENIDTLQQILSDRAEYLLNTKTTNLKPMVIHIDEGQLLWQSKDAMTRRNKQLEKILQTVRYLGVCWIICTPSIRNISKELMRRIDWLVIAEKDVHYIWIRDFDYYMGKLYYLEERLYSMKSGVMIQPKTWSIEKMLNISADIEAKTPYYKDIYNKYAPIKLQKTAEFLKNVQIVKKEKKDVVKNDRPKVEFNVEIKHGGNGEIDRILNNVAYINNYYSYKDLAKVIKNYTLSTLKNKLPNYDNIRKKTKGRTIYLHLGDVIKVLDGRKND